MKKVPFLSSKNNKVEGYHKFFHTKTYLKQKAANYPMIKWKEWAPKLAEQVGYRKIQKFLNHMEEWNRVERKVPLAYLKAIGVDMDTLDFTLELDREDFKRVSEGPFYPRRGSIRFHPAYYKSIEFPEGIDEDEGVEILRGICVEKGLRGFIELYPVKTIGVRVDGSVYEIFNRPEIVFTERFMIHKGAGDQGMGVYV